MEHHAVLPTFGWDIAIFCSKGSYEFIVSEEMTLHYKVRRMDEKLDPSFNKFH